MDKDASELAPKRPLSLMRSNLSEDFRKNGNLLFLDDTLSADGNKVILQTQYLNDTLLEDLGDNTYQWPIIQSQIVFFYPDQDRKITISPELGGDNESIVRRGGKVSHPFITIWAHSLVKIKGFYIYCMYGSANCNGTKCPEYFGYFHKDGRCIIQGIGNDEQFKKARVLMMQELEFSEWDLKQCFENAKRIDYFFFEEN
jgi:hypothetical protein